MPSSKRSGCQSTEQTQWKLSHQSTPGSDQNPQKTLSELFATSEKPSVRPESIEAEGPSPSKRLKFSHTSPSTTLLPKNITTAEMYSFPPSTPKRNSSTNGAFSESEVIDLTGSPGAGTFKPASTRRKPSGTVRPTVSRPQSGPKKLVVKNLKKAPQADPEQYYNHVWNQLDAALSAIFVGGDMPYSFEELYKGVESLCRQDHAPAVYKKLREKCKQNVSVQVLEPLVQSASAVDTVDTLNAVVKAWSTWMAHLVNFTEPLKWALLTYYRLPSVQFFSTWTDRTSYSLQH